MITIAVEPAEVEAGARATARVRFLPGIAGPARRIRVEVGWRTEGRGDPDAGVIETAAFAPVDAAPDAPADFHVPFQIPADGPISYDGKILRIIWEARARAELDGGERGETEIFRVVPRVVTA